MADDWKPDGARELPVDDWKPEGARALEAAAAPQAAAAAAPAQPKTLGRRMEEFAAPVIGAMSPLHVLTHLGDTTPTTPEELGSEARAALNGVTLGHAPQILGWLDPKNAGEFQKDYAQASKDNRVAEMAGAMALPIPGTGALKALEGAGGVAARVLANGAIGFGLGLATGGTDASPTQRALTGFGLGTLGGGVAEWLSGLGQKASSAVKDIDEAVARKAAADAAAETAQARSAAGRAAQDTYKQLEHLRELGAKGMLSPELQALSSKLESELAEKAASRLEASAAEKAATGGKYAEALSTEGDRAKQLAEQKLSGGELKQQLGARLTRYGLPAVLGAVGSSLMGHSPAEGALFGGALGHTFRPMAHSLRRLVAQPVVQRQLATGAASLLGQMGPAAEQSLPAVVQELEPMLGPLVPQFADDDAAARQKAQALALRSPREKPQ